MQQTANYPLETSITNEVLPRPLNVGSDSPGHAKKRAYTMCRRQAYFL